MTHDDLAAADAALLASDTVIDGATPPLTGGEALEFANVDSTLATILGREPQTMRSFLSARLAGLNK